MKAIVFRTKTKSDEEAYLSPPISQVEWDDDAPRNNWWDGGRGNWTITFTTVNELQAFIDGSDEAIILRREPENTKWGIPAHYTLEIYDGYRE